MACPTSSIVRACEFTQFLVDQLPVYDKLILEDIRPTDGWILNMKTGTFDAYSGTEHTLDRFTDVWPDTTKEWVRTSGGNCLGTPCDKTEHCIGWGAKRLTYYLEEQSWATPLLCYDQEMHITHAREQFRQIISNILKPATSAIMSSFMRKRALLHAGKKWVANSTMQDFTYVFQAVGTSEIYFQTNIPPSSIYMLTPQMLQRRVSPLMRIGYMGKNPFAGKMPDWIELVTDMATMWDLDKLGGSVGVGGTGNPSVTGNWRFTQWSAANEYWRYGFTGQLGNYAIRMDELGLRFNFVQDLGAGSAPQPLPLSGGDALQEHRHVRRRRLAGLAVGAQRRLRPRAIRDLVHLAQDGHGSPRVRCHAGQSRNAVFVP